MASVLLLNMNYQPLSTLSVKEAVRLIMRGCVEPVPCEDGEVHAVATVHSISATVPVPEIIRLRRYVRAPKRGATWSRHGVKVRDHYTCVYCGAKVGDRRGAKDTYSYADFTVDHIIPQDQGGQNTWVNTACACSMCNRRKSNRTPNEAGMKMLWSPGIPRVGYVVIRGDVPQSWKLYIQTSGTTPPLG